MPIHLVLLCAGRGTRLADDDATPKALRDLGGQPLLAWSLRAARAAGIVHRVVIVAPAEALERFRAAAALAEPLATPALVVPGGDTRVASSAAGLAAAGPEAEIVLVHDAARPLASAALFARVAAAARAHGAAIPVIPVADTIKELVADERGTRVARTLLRARLGAVQTPQGFRAAWLREGLARAAGEPSEEGFTDDASLVEAAGREVQVVAGEPENFKITTALDLVRAEIFVRARLDKNLRPA